MAKIKIRYYIDPVIQQPHIYTHSVVEREIAEVLNNPGEDRQGEDDSRVALGQTQEGRYLKVIYVPDPKPNSIFVITAYELKGKPLMAYKRRKRRNQR